MCTKNMHHVCAQSMCTKYKNMCIVHHAPICTPLGGPYEHQVCRLPTRSTGNLHQAWWAYSCPSAPANQVQSAITELICSTSMHCNGAKNITCLPTHGEPNKSPDLRVGTITPDLMPKIIDALDYQSVSLNRPQSQEKRLNPHNNVCTHKFHHFKAESFLDAHKTCFTSRHQQILGTHIRCPLALQSSSKMCSKEARE